MRRPWIMEVRLVQIIIDTWKLKEHEEELKQSFFQSIILTQYQTILKHTQSKRSTKSPELIEIKLFLFLLDISKPIVSCRSVGGHISLSSHGVQMEHQGSVTTSVSVRGPESSSHGGIPSIRVIYERADCSYYTWIKTGWSHLGSGGSFTCWLHDEELDCS